MVGTEGGGGFRRDPHLSFLAPGARNILFPPGEEFAELMVLILQTHSRERERAKEQSWTRQLTQMRAGEQQQHKWQDVKHFAHQVKAGYFYG